MIVEALPDNEDKDKQDEVDIVKKRIPELKVKVKQKE